MKKTKPGWNGLAFGAELLSVLFGSFLLNLIPFAGPSNLLIASNAALLVHTDPFTLGLLVALGSASAKFIHYLVTFFVGGFLSKERREQLGKVNSRVGKWAFAALFIAAATPIPDEPVIIPLGLMKYNPAKFCLAMFLGKISITVPGAYLGQLGQSALSSLITQEALIVLSLILTIAITIILLRIDITKTLRKTKRNNRTKTANP
ncbi:MAG: VTT domain-containing protein [Candidatus Bathyarchaeia archaeon]